MVVSLLRNSPAAVMSHSSPASSSASSAPVTVLVSLPSPATSPQTVSLRLYIHDKSLACASAALSASATRTIREGDYSVSISFQPDMTVTQIGKTWDEMVNPSMYVILDAALSTVKYDSGPVFGVGPGQSDVALKVKEKE